jgi:hypothetical protein
MDQATVGALADGGFGLSAFKAVQAASATGAPLVWFASTDFALQTTLSWTDDCQAFTTSDPIVQRTTVLPQNAYDIATGDTLSVTGKTGTGSVISSGLDGTIGIQNGTTTPFTSGLLQAVAGSQAPLCAFPLHGQQLNLITPLEQVLLTISAAKPSVGEVVSVSYGPGVLIDLTEAPSPPSVTYGIDVGWSWGGGTWATSHAAEAPLPPLLIQPSIPLGRELLALIGEGWRAAP